MAQTRGVLRRRPANINIDYYSFLKNNSLTLTITGYCRTLPSKRQKALAETRAVLRRTPANINFDYYSFL